MNYGQANHIMQEQQIKQRQAEAYNTGRLDVDQRLFDGAKQTCGISPAQSSIESLEKNVAMLGEALTVLSERLAVVTRQGTACENPQEGLDKACSPLVNRINCIDKRVQQLTQSLQLQLELLEI